MYLIDTNIWLERLLDQERSQEVGDFLNKVTTDNIKITDFAFHSICVILDNLGEREALNRFVDDLFLQSEVNLISLPPALIDEILEAANQFNLDFDDAYQYVAASRYDFQIISFDTDFDRTKKGRKTPSEVL